MSAASQSKTELTDFALKGDLALRGESRWDTAGLGGSLKLGKAAAPVGGADIGGGATDVKGLGGTHAAVAGGDGLSLFVLVLVALEVRDNRDSFEASDCRLFPVLGAESDMTSPDAAAVAAAAGLGELRSMALVKKSV